MIDGLTGAAARVAGELLAMFPGVVLTSGRRSVEDQARVMAANVTSHRLWVGETYAKPLCAAAKHLHALAQSHHLAKPHELESIFAAALRTYSDAELRKLSRHLSGEAFDVRPASDAVMVFLSDAAKREGGKFLTREGGKVIWHWQGP